MILAFIEDGTVELFKTETEACNAFEGVDAESEVVMFYNESGTPLKPEFSEPNEYHKFLLFMEWSRSGKYHLIQDSNENRDPLWLVLLETSYLKPNNDFRNLSDLKLYLAKNGVQVSKDETNPSD